MIIADAVLALLALGRFAVALRAIVERQRLDYAEPTVYAQAARLLQGEPLYQLLERTR